MTGVSAAGMEAATGVGALRGERLREELEYAELVLAVVPPRMEAATGEVAAAVPEAASCVTNTTAWGHDPCHIVRVRCRWRTRSLCVCVCV